MEVGSGPRTANLLSTARESVSHHRTTHTTAHTPAQMTVKFKIDEKNKVQAKFRKTDQGDYECLCSARFWQREEVEEHLNLPSLDKTVHSKTAFNNRYKGGGG